MPGCRISDMGVCMVLCRLGAQLLPAERLSTHRHAARGSGNRRFLYFANDYVDSLNATYTKAIPNDIKQRAWQSTLQGYRQLEDMGINRPFNSKAHAKTMLFSRLSSMAGVTGSMAPFFCEFTLNADIRRHEYPA